MSVAALALSWMLQNPQAVVDAANHVTRPGAVDPQVMQRSFADFTRGILSCYHRTGRYQVADVIQQPWTRQSDYAAEGSALIRISYTGLTGTKYQMDVALLRKQKLIRTAVLQDTASVPYSKRCQLEQWTGADDAEPKSNR